jgi:signal transduction histidine kinase/CheY-like chemotaxis protein
LFLSYSTVFWTVLVLLLAGGFLYSVLLWLRGGWEEKHQTQLGSLYDLAEDVMGSSEPAAVVRRMGEILPRITDCTHAAVWILDPPSRQLEFQAGTEEPVSVSLSLDSMSGAVTCFRNRVMTEVADAENCPFVSQETARHLGQKSLLYMPIIADGACLGVIEVEDRDRKRIFPREQKERLQHVARLAALALRHRVQAALREDLHRSEKWKALRELIEGVGRELVRPLGKILAFAEDPQDDDHPTLLAGRLKAIDEQARQASGRLARLFELAGSGQGSFQQIDLNELLSSVASRFKQRWKRKGLELSIKLSKTRARVSADEPQLEEILVNLFRHAERLIEQQGLRSMEIYSHVLETTVAVSMTPAELKRVGDAEEEAGGSSRQEAQDVESTLGLSICQVLIERAGGEMRVNEAGGRSFSIEIKYPLVQQAHETLAPAPDAHARPAAKSIMALVIDDDLGAQDALLYHLTERGHRVIPVGSLDEGLDLSERMPFDWLFCNVQMGRKSGLDVYRLFQNRVKRFIFLANEDVAIYNQEFFAGNDRTVLRKPIKGEAVDRLFEAPAAASPQLRVSKPTGAYT